MSNATTCTLEEQVLFDSTNGASIVCLNRGDSIGLTLVAESGFISMIALLGVFSLIFRNALRNGKLIRHPTDIYMLSLFAFDLIMASGRVLDVKWIHEGKLYIGHFCTAQGAIQQLGETGSALATLAIAIHTVVVVLWRVHRHLYFVAFTVVGLTWLFVGLFVVLGVSLNTHGSNLYETPDGYWCWIGNRYRAEQFAGQYIWVWTTVVVSFLAYTPLFFWARGNLTMDPTHWWKIQIHKDKYVVPDADPESRKRRSIGMIVYPIVFAIITLPLSAVRLRTGFGSTRRHLPTATFAVEFLYSLSGALNVLLFLFTRSDLLLPPNRSSNKLGKVADVTLRESKTDSMNFNNISRLEARQRSRGNQPLPLGLLPGADDMGWQLPTAHDGNESA